MPAPEALREMISEYRRKIALYEQMIAEWERELGVNGGSVTGSSTAAQNVTGQPEARSDGGQGDPVAMVRQYQFFGKSQPEAARAFLEMIGHPLTTDQLLDGLEKGGLKLGGKNRNQKKSNFATVLIRAGSVVRVGRGAWGLEEWPAVKRVLKESGEKKAGETNASPEGEAP